MSTEINLENLLRKTVRRELWPSFMFPIGTHYLSVIRCQSVVVVIVKPSLYGLCACQMIRVTAFDHHTYAITNPSHSKRPKEV